MAALVWWLAATCLLRAATAGNPDAKRLYDDLLSNYNKLVRPVVNTTDVLRVCIKLKLSQLIDVVSVSSVARGRRAGPDPQTSLHSSFECTPLINSQT
ncbi:acetylcholine receptor subunit alpha-like [Trichoplusia ni]|uniref:Acetylcholine receptor subunit alpha-like n=1 Tax=Trichoplusia ni TaxID=7111 RepID=A0A7E5W9R8_TRINI|nr:acetylcholine receptor subunit alpha-like [Trichoplusia ni]